MYRPQDSVAETLQQVIEGLDFDPPAKMLGTVKPADAVRILPGFPYSIATNVAHAEQWQRHWLHQLRGLPSFHPYHDAKDFRAVSAEEWPAVREAFLRGLANALEIARSDPFSHRRPTDEDAIKKLNQIAVHGAYHLGQVKLLKRLLRSAPKDPKPIRLPSQD